MSFMRGFVAWTFDPHACDAATTSPGVRGDCTNPFPWLPVPPLADSRESAIGATLGSLVSLRASSVGIERSSRVRLRTYKRYVRR